jgi:hypothetical protein
MKNYTLPLLLLFTSCKTYHYMTPTINTAMYSGAGDVQAGLQFGSAGIAANAGVALTKNVNINGFASFFPESDNGYNSRELEISLGYQTTPGETRKRVTSFFLGFGHGDNEYDKKGLAGKFNRPFLQIQHGTVDRMLFGRSSIFADVFFGARLNWLNYDGEIEGSNFDDDFLYFEPYYGVSVGGSKVRFHVITGVPIKTDNWDEGVRVRPFFMNIGLQVKFRKR